MNANEPNALFRKLAMRLTVAGAGLAQGHVFAAGDVKLVKPDGTIANTLDMPTFVVGAAAGSWDLQLEAAEIVERGNYRVQISGVGVDLHEEIFFVDATRLVDVILEGPAQYDGAGEAQPPGDPNNYNVTIAGALRLILSYVSNPANNLDGIAGAPLFKSRVGGRNRIVAVLNNGNRGITSRDDT